MLTNSSMLFVASILLLTSTTSGQDPAAADTGDRDVSRTNIAEQFLPFGVGDMLQMAVELRKAGESLERFGESLNNVSTIAAEAAGSTSQNLAAIGGEFDPFGYKTAFQTIQQQNVVIQAQSQMIIQMQRKEIRRLEQQTSSTHRPKRRSRRKRPARVPNSSEE